MSLLQVNNLTVRYTYGNVAVSNLSFNNEEANLLTVLGRTESGKTSLLKCISGLLKQSGGQIFLNSKDISLLSVKDRNVCLIYENGRFFENRTVLYNLEYPLKIRKIANENRQKEIIKIIKKVGISEDLLKAKVSKLSSTERIKLSFARALLRNADLYLIDDPLKILTSKERADIFPLAEDLMDELSSRGLVIYATTEASECSKLGGKIVYLNYGICVQQGSADEIKNYPASLTALEMFNDNYLKQTVKICSEDDSIYVDFNGEKIELDDKKLLSGIFVGKEAEAVRLSGQGALRLYDAESEQIIYFD